MRAYAIFKLVPGLVGVPLVITGGIADNTSLLVVGFVFLGVYAAEMAVITPVVLARRGGRIDADPVEDPSPTPEAPPPARDR
jgi:hypothetical protein